MQSVSLSVFVACFVLNFVRIADAAIVYHLPAIQVQVAYGEQAVGFVDVYGRAETFDLPQDASSFNVDFSVSSNDIVLEKAILANDALLQSAPMDFSPSTVRSRSAVDVFPASAGLTSHFGLVRVPFISTVDAVGTYALEWESLNELADSTANPLPIGFSAPGEITISRYLPGDFDGNNRVDGQDFLLWQRGESQSPRSQHDLDSWESNYGTHLQLQVFVVPEVDSQMLIIMSAALAMVHRRY